MTTLAFVRSLIRWQVATAYAASSPHPHALLATVDLEEAAVDTKAARAWITFLERVARGMKESAESCENENVGLTIRATRTCVLEAIEHAREHMAALEAGSRLDPSGTPC